MVKSKGFHFYKILKNEDAPPYYFRKGDRGFLIAADGLGGAGSFVHEFSPKEYKDIEKRVKKAAYPEFFGRTRIEEEQSDAERIFGQWIDRLFDPMFDKDPDTSALWGSRVVISRFSKLVKDNFDRELASESFRQQLIEYIYDGMLAIQKEFKLETGKIKGQLVLPTTLVCAKYSVLKDNKIEVEVVWAGDSRAYAILPNEGLKQLSIDDEDGSGAITNLFAIKEGKPLQTVLHYKKFVLPAKSVLFVCSDGFFDPYDPIDNIGVEVVFLECLSKSNSFDELKDNWYSHYEPMTHDDCSIAFLAFGYEAKDFNSFKSTFIKRYKSVDEAFNRYYRDKKYIPYALGEEENPEEYIYDRADSRREEIARKIAVELINNPQTAESVVTPKIKSFFDTLIEKTKVSRATEKLTKEKEKSEELEKLLLDDYSKDYTLVKKLFEIDESGEGVDLKTVNDLKDLLVTVDLLLQKYEDISAFEKESESKIPSCDKIDQSRDELIQKIIARIDEIAIATEMYERLLENAKEEKEWNKENSVSPDFTSMIDRIIKHYELGVTVSKNEIVALNKLIDILMNKGEMVRQTYGYKSGAVFDQEVKSILTKYRKVESDKKAIEEQKRRLYSELDFPQQEYQKKVKRLDSEIIVRSCHLYLSEESQKELGLPIRESESLLTEEVFAGALDEYFEKAKEVFDEVIEAFLKETDQTVIDTIFNQSRLRICREFKKMNREEVIETKEITEKMVDEYENLAKYEVKE